MHNISQSYYSNELIEKCQELTPQMVCKGAKYISFVNQLNDATLFLSEISPSLTTKFYCVLNNITEIPKCICGNNVMANKKDNKLGFTQFCSAECSRKNKTLTKNLLEILESYDWLYNQRITLEKSKETIAKELGCSITPINKWLKIHSILDRKYNKSKIDFSDTLDNKEWLYEQYVTLGATLRKISENVGCGTNITISYLKKHNIHIRNGSEAQLTQYAIEYLSNKEWLYDQYITNKKTQLEISKLLNCGDSTVGNYMTIHDIDIRDGNSVSSYEHIIRNILDKYDITYITNTRTIISPYELDIFIDELNIAIEINGLYWHSELHKSNNYHEMKRKKCEEFGIRLISLYEDDIVYKRDIIERFLANVFNKTVDKIFARNCVVNYNPDKNLCKKLLDEYHIQGGANSTKEIALEYNNIIVAVMLFNDNVLTRYATSTNIIGGFSKLIKSSGINNIITFVDLDMFTGETYIKTGFKIDRYISPDYKYIIRDIRHHKFNYRKKRFKTDINLVYIENKTEHELALINKLYRIYDSGKYRLVLDR